MGEKAKEVLKLQFDKRLRLEFHGARITSDAGLLACRELDEVLGLTEMAPIYLQETRGGRNVQHELVPLLRQSVYSRLAGYEDTNDAVRLARDPAMQAVVGRRALERQAASTNTLSRFETEVLVTGENIERPGANEYSVGRPCHGADTSPANDPGHGQLGKPGIWGASRQPGEKDGDSMTSIVVGELCQR